MPWTDVIFYREDETVLALDWLRALPAKAQDKCLAYLLQLEALGRELRRPLAAPLRDGIYELRPSCRGVHYRILYFFSGKNVVVVSHGIRKEAEVPGVEIDRAIERRERFEANPKKHTFRRRK
jgi:phage-related protein